MLCLKLKMLLNMPDFGGESFRENAKLASHQVLVTKNV
jgi:hypothetical protein